MSKKLRISFKKARDFEEEVFRNEKSMVSDSSFSDSNHSSFIPVNLNNYDPVKTSPTFERK